MPNEREIVNGDGKFIIFSRKEQHVEDICNGSLKTFFK